MFSKLKEVVEISMNALAPSPPLHDDFLYQWRRFLKHYNNLNAENRTAVELTYLPDCLDQLRKILVHEDEQMIQNNETIEIGPCMEYLLKNNLLDILVSVAILEEPPGIKSCVLQFFSKTLTQLKAPNLAHSAMYAPLMKLMNVCDGLLHSVCEHKEIDFLLNLCAVLRKQPAITIMFFSKDSTKYLTEISEAGDSIQYKGILDLVLTYVDSADSEIRVKACQCIILLCCVEDETIANCIVEDFNLNHFLIGRLTTLFYGIPPNNYEQFKNIDASWTLDNLSDLQMTNVKNREAVVFFTWLDFINHLSEECHLLIKSHLKHCVTDNFLRVVFETKYLPFPKTIAIFHKYYSCITSAVLISGFREWLIFLDLQVPNISTTSVIFTVINNCYIDDEFVASTSLTFFAEVFAKCDEQIIHSLVLCYLKERLYYDTSAVAASWSDEEDERQKYSSSPEASSCSKTLAPSTIDRIINSFVNLIPPLLRSKETEENNVKLLQSLFEQILRDCSKFHWPSEAMSDVETISNDSNPEADSQCKNFYEGPFLRMLFTKIKNLPKLEYSQMSTVCSIILKLAILPHPFLHEYFLNPSLPLRKGVPSLYSCLQYVVNDVVSMVEVVVNFQSELEITRKNLRTNEGNICHSKNKIDRYLLACVLLEDLCNELAAIGYVKYAYFHKFKMDE